MGLQRQRNMRLYRGVGRKEFNEEIKETTIKDRVNVPILLSRLLQWQNFLRLSNDKKVK